MCCIIQCHFNYIFFVIPIFINSIIIIIISFFF